MRGLLENAPELPAHIDRERPSTGATHALRDVKSQQVEWREIRGTKRWEQTPTESGGMDEWRERATVRHATVPAKRKRRERSRHPQLDVSREPTGRHERAVVIAGRGNET